MPRDTLNLDADLVWGGLWPGATADLIAELEDRIDLDGGPVLCVKPSSRPHGDGWTVVGNHADEGACFEWVPLSGLMLALPGPRGCGLHVLTEAIKERVGIDSQGKVRAPASGATWRTASEVADACLSGSVPHIMWASRYLVMTDALAAARGWPAGKGAPVWSWTEAAQIAPDGTRRWNLSARASSTENWSRLFISDLTDPMAALEDVWRRRGDR